MMTDALDGQEKIDLEIHDQEKELNALELDAIAKGEKPKVVNDIKKVEEEVHAIVGKQDTLTGEIEDSLEFLDETDANDIESLSLEEAISEDRDVLREQQEQLKNLKDVYGEVTDRTEKNEVAKEFNQEKALAVKEQNIIKKEEQLAAHEELVNQGKGSNAIKQQIKKEEEEIELDSTELAELDATEILHEEVTMEKVKESHAGNGKIIEDANEVVEDGLNLEFDMELAISDEEVLFADDKSALKTGGKVGGEVGDAHEQAFKAENKFKEDHEELIERHSVEETVKAQVEKHPC